MELNHVSDDLSAIPAAGAAGAEPELEQRCCSDQAILIQLLTAALLVLGLVQILVRLVLLIVMMLRSGRVQLLVSASAEAALLLTSCFASMAI